MTDNIPRILPRGLAVEIDPKTWPTQPIFEYLKILGNVPDDDYRRTFNLGIGMVLVIPAKKLGFVSQILRKLSEPFYHIGQVIPHRPKQPKVKYL